MRTSRLALVALIAGCRSAPVPTPTTPETRPPSNPANPTYERGIARRPAPPLPAVPLVTGPLAPKLVFPEANQTIPVRDSNFIFGSVGNGHATVTINGAPVTVAPNGTFLAYLPVPPPTAPR
jgi:N-acetylmuramoyl-L-alanine amidase